MSTEAHLAELIEKHHALEAQIEEELERPLADTLKVTEIKREKLRIKEQITRLQGEQEQVA
jgi:hypothetical protein